MSDQIKRKYELRQRAADMEATRLRIAEAAMELHGTVGPARTTVTAVAERAGVQRHTVYRHFPTDDDLFTACSGLWAERLPVPDVAGWRAISDPGERLARGSTSCTAGTSTPSRCSRTSSATRRWCRWSPIIAPRSTPCSPTPRGRSRPAGRGARR